MICVGVRDNEMTRVSLCVKNDLSVSVCDNEMTRVCLCVKLT
jgi:hypothetical protein